MTADEKTSGKDVVRRGIGVSPGVVVGPVFLLASEEDRVVERSISRKEIAGEITRLEGALIETRRQIKEIQNNIRASAKDADASIFDAHLMVLDDGSFIEEVIRELEKKRKNVEIVLKMVAKQYVTSLSAVEDDYLRERVMDVRDVVRRLLRNLTGEQKSEFESLRQKHIIVARDLAPSETASMRKEMVHGFATDHGSATSHTAVMARAFEIPAIVGLHDITSHVTTGDRVLLDGNKGIFIIHPTSERLKQYGEVIETRRSIESGLSTLKHQPAETKDGCRVVLAANIETADDIDSVTAYGAYGVGLFRSEYLYLSRKDKLPSEDEQAEAYTRVAERLAPAPVIIRTLDLGGDKFLSHVEMPKEMNPFLGCRAIRLCLAKPDLFKTQLKAIVRASKVGNVKIMYPMVTNVDEVIKANEILEKAKAELRAEGRKFDPNIEVGVMIETPSAALTAEVIAPHVRFFSLGTNDLVQYTLAVDRVNETMAYLYEPTHPAILKLIKHTINVGHNHGFWIGVCGEMAGDPLMSPLLLGLGIDEFSMAPAAVPLIKDVIRSVTMTQARKLAEIALLSKSASDVLRHCRRLTRKVAPEILELV